MDYYIHTDGSCRLDKELTGAAYVIVTDKLYINASCESFNSRYAFDAELNAIILALRYLTEHVELTFKDKVTFFVDSVKAIILCDSIIYNEYCEDEKVSVYPVLKYELEQVLETGVNVEFIKVKAHKSTFSTNKVVDRLANIAIVHFDPITIV